VTIAEKEAAAQDTEEAAKRKEAEAEERKQQSHEMVAESIRRELLESVYPALTHLLILRSRRGEGGKRA
jgi:cell division protein FtsB